MGLTSSSTGQSLKEELYSVKKGSENDRVIALAGNPNVGKSTVFNELTGLKQHTGNWTGKTVSMASGVHRGSERDYIIVDLPGSYSLLPLSHEESVARDYICFGGADAVIVVCDATCLERNMNLVLQILEITSKTVVCVNLMDEAAKKGLKLDLPALSKKLGVPVVGTSARSGKGLDRLSNLTEKSISSTSQHYTVRYPEPLEQAVVLLEMHLANILDGALSERWTALRLLEGDERTLSLISSHLGFDITTHHSIAPVLEKAAAILEEAGYSPASLRSDIVTSIYSAAEHICSDVVAQRDAYSPRQLRADLFLTKRSTGIPVMLLLLAVIFYITIKGANYPSSWLSAVFAALSPHLEHLLSAVGLPQLITDCLVDGVYRVLTWVISVMLPPMAIFFPLFTLLEDLGYLPRVAFNLDNSFKKCRACGKQALTMCMGFGCNAAGVVGCRIIASPREKLIAVLTNSFVPCNGRFPTLITVISLFFVSAAGTGGTLISSLILTAVIVLSVLMTLFVSYLLSHTLLKGQPSSLTLEMPPFRRPQIGKVIVHSIVDRTLFVLGRAVAAAAPAGLLIWLMANISAGGSTLLAHVTDFLDPFARVFGMDGVILTAFILGLPANEIVFPIILMAYTASGTLTEVPGLAALAEILTQNGWTIVTAACTVVFSLMHWPCATTLMTIRKETGSIKWMLLSALIPTVCGLSICFIINSLARIPSIF